MTRVNPVDEGRVRAPETAPNLLIAPCSTAAARHAVQRWHYSTTLPRGRSIRLGVWEADRFIGAVIVSHSATQNLGAPYGLSTHECVELTRVALREHQHPVTQIVAQVLARVRATQPGVRLVVSFADPEHSHHGGIYQAGNWIYTGMTTASTEYVVNGRRYQGRALRNLRRTHPQPQHGRHPNVLSWARAVLDKNAAELQGSAKYRYLMPMDRQMRRRVAPLARPYPPAMASNDARKTPMSAKTPLAGGR